MRSDVQKEARRILEAVADGDWEAALRKNGRPPVNFEAIDFLEQCGAIGRMGNGPPFITPTGYDYYEKLKEPKVYWLKENWFRVAVLVAIQLA